MSYDVMSLCWIGKSRKYQTIFLDKPSWNDAKEEWDGPGTLVDLAGIRITRDPDNWMACAIAEYEVRQHIAVVEMSRHFVIPMFSAFPIIVIRDSTRTLVEIDEQKGVMAIPTGKLKPMSWIHRADVPIEIQQRSDGSDVVVCGMTERNVFIRSPEENPPGHAIMWDELMSSFHYQGKEIGVEERMEAPFKR